MNYFNYILAVLSVLVLFFCLFAVASLLFRKNRIAARFMFFLRKFSYWAVLIFSAGGVLGSLAYSAFFKLEPCILCWWQRIFLFPIAIVVALGLIKKEKVMDDYLLALAVPGVLISLYHSFIQLPSQTTSFLCSGGVSDCTESYFSILGFITIPFMAFSVFVAIIVLIIIRKIIKDLHG